MPALSEPLVSIGMPVFHKQRHLPATLHSALQQTHRNLEVILADNGSRDATSQLCRDAAAGDGRVRFVQNRCNLGSRRNFNLVFELARGKFFVWGRGHDLWAPQFVARAVAILQQDPDVVLVHARANLIDLEDRDLGPVAETLDTRGLDLPQRLMATWRGVLGPATLGVARTAAMDHTNLYQDLAGCDIVCLLELAVQGSFAFVDEPLLSLRKVRDEDSEAETVRRTWAQLNPFRQRREPPDCHVLEFLGQHLRIVRELPLRAHTRDDLLADLVDDCRGRFQGSLQRALSAVAARVQRAVDRQDAIDCATALQLLDQLQLGLLFRPDHCGAAHARDLLLDLILDLTSTPQPTP
jgi:hypothetical protein